jgi:Fungal hydrophobin
MLSKLSVLIVAVLVSLAAGTPTSGGGQCATYAECCDTVEPASKYGDANFWKSLGVNLQNPNVPIGLGCSPISAVGVGSTWSVWRIGLIRCCD